MKALGIVEVNITDPSWIEEYTEKVTPMVAKYGGRYLTRSEKIELVEGEAKPQVLVVTEFPSKAAALEFYHSKDYEPYRLARQKGAKAKFMIVDVENGTEI